MIRLLVIFILATSCCRKLSVRSEYLTEASLASYHVGTPDPRRGCPLSGQQLIISWQIPNALWHGQELVLKIAIRFRNGEESHEEVTCNRSLGTIVYAIQDEEFAKKRGILTYQVQLFEDGEMTETWTHPLWQERINF